MKGEGSRMSTIGEIGIDPRARGRADGRRAFLFFYLELRSQKLP